jgi:hypothetical protein
MMLAPESFKSAKKFSFPLKDFPSAGIELL